MNPICELFWFWFDVFLAVTELAGKAELIKNHVIACEQETHFVFHHFALLPYSKQHMFLCQVPICV